MLIIITTGDVFVTSLSEFSLPQRETLCALVMAVNITAAGAFCYQNTRVLLRAERWGRNGVYEDDTSCRLVVDLGSAWI